MKCFTYLMDTVHVNLDKSPWKTFGRGRALKRKEEKKIVTFKTEQFCFEFLATSEATW